MEIRISRLLWYLWCKFLIFSDTNKIGIFANKLNNLKKASAFFDHFYWSLLFVKVIISEDNFQKIRVEPYLFERRSFESLYKVLKGTFICSL